MAYTDADLATIRAAISSGLRSVTFADGRKTEWQSVAEMVAAEKVIVANLAMVDRAALGISRRRFAKFGSGF